MKALIYEIIAVAGTIDAAGVRILRPLGLTPMTFNILNVLSDGPLSQREISDQVIVAASSITFQVKQLQKKGLIQRRRSDARTWRVFLTPRGAETRRRAEQRMNQIMDQIRIEPGLIANAKSALKTIQDRLPELVEGKNPL
ncbi:MAG TPA: MarR family transcriptional regulator [Opitutaceae bacterium]|jgi:DNA-binding MarR family transcriptional regulator|nr:MarR family transcriptional regulator [Opitutaceae bacterium]